MNIAYPYQFDHGGRTAQARDEAHVRDLIEQVLFTSPKKLHLGVGLPFSAGHQ